MMNSKHIDLIYDYLDEASNIIYEELHLDYLDCLIRVCDDINKGINESKLSKESLSKLEKIYERFFNHSFMNEEIRQALELLIVKGLKHRGRFSLDLMTPDSICYLFAHIINLIGENRISIMDVAIGTGNLINAISNFVDYEVDLIGIDINATLCDLARSTSDLQGNNIKIYCNDHLFPILDKVDVVIGDLDMGESLDKYQPYEVISKSLDNLHDDGMFIYLITNDFFNQKEAQDFKNNFNGTLAGLIILPETMFNKNHIGKSILIGTKKKLDNYDLLLVNFPSLQDEVKVQETIVMIDEWIKILKGMII